MALQSFVGPWGRFFSFFNPIPIVRTPWTGISPSQGSYLHTEQHEQNKRTQTSMTRVRFEPTTPAFKWAKTVHALDRTATVIGNASLLLHVIFMA
jgi:hypothetical protein